ncbi:MAG TPA: NAD(P)H-hydrate dehydratase [Elusimicrobiota bacterium]|nr:NAD(P)H-hydrate dehydratase [Elusimicrobiota bacterium]
MTKKNAAHPITVSLVRKWIVPRPAAAHKGDFGHVFVLAGSRGMTGAACLCASGALRGGAGLVTLGVPEGQQSVVATSGRWETMTRGLPETDAGTFDEIGWKYVDEFVSRRPSSVLALGPGIGSHHSTGLFVRNVICHCGTPVVMDADAINLVASTGWPLDVKTPVVLTPHPGELGRLMGVTAERVNSQRAEWASKAAQKTGGVCVLKGHETVVSDGEKTYVNPTGNPGMAGPGMGDVLCGLTASLVGQVSADNMDERLMRAALLAVFIHGLAGDLAAQKKTRISLLAGDVVDCLPDAFRKVFGAAV